ncbi:helix-turn-helix domain-containing protein [Gordonia sp. CPCC 205515]|uniref:sigma-54-dependent Fis family transcriptional regulator n=1 Tax=Gordonia sp. CPCC 205515 TaxID=3140791 RepID=UPI003AF3B7B0
MSLDSEADLRPEIALGWRRSLMSGLDPGMEVKESTIFEVDRHSRLIRAADPVLTRMADELNDTRFSVLLADHGARIVDRRRSNRVLDRHLDRVKAVPGAQYVEEVSGTNSLATAFELRKPIAVTGDEHFLEALRVFCCYGAPIIHPITRRLEGVLDVTGPREDLSNLLGPFLMRAVRDIEQRLQEGSRLTEQRLFAEFQQESARRKSAILLFGENLALSNAAAMDLITTDDHPTLRALAEDLDNHDRLTRTLSLTSGRSVDVHARLVEGGRDGVIIEVVPTRESGARPTVRRSPSGIERRVVSIVGAPGAGKSTRAAQIAGDEALIVDFATAASQSIWRPQVADAIRAEKPLVFDNLHLCETRDAATIRMLTADAKGVVVLVTSADTELGGELRALLSTAAEHETLPLVRDVGARLPQIVHDILERVTASNDVPSDAADRLRMTPSALDVLIEQEWPENLTELTRVLRIAARGRTRGDVTVEDLPSTHRVRPSRTLTPLERAERATILSALRDSDGNKAAAATALGIGRNTLYQRLRYYQIS